MKITITNDQYRDLLALAYLGEWVANSYEKDRRRYLLEKTQQLLYGLAEDASCGDWVALDPKQKRYLPTTAMEKVLGPLVDMYDQNVFWDLLAERLADRDLLRERGHDAVHEMSDKEYDVALRPYLEKWWDEMDDHGLDRLAAPDTDRQENNRNK